MSPTLTIAAVSIVLVAGICILRAFVRRLRRLRRLDRAERRVSEAMADGRLTTAAGEAVLQHLDGLRRACARWREG
jgi:HAMP domain-containing protein